MPNATKPVPDVEYYGDGGVREGFQLVGQMHGAWQFFRKDGSVMRSGEGQVVKETEFPKGA